MEVREQNIKEIRRLSQDDLRALCIKNNWYTKGTSEEYDNLLNLCNVRNITKSRIYKIADNIKKHSNTEQEVTSIMFEVARTCDTLYYIIEEDNMGLE